MLPDEEANRETISRGHATEFAIVRRLLQLGLTFQSAIIACKELPISTKIKAFVVGALTRDIRRFRSCIAECELGHAENTMVLNRSLFESILSVRFVLGIEQTGALPLPIPPGVDPPDFRADLYLSMGPLGLWRTGKKVLSDPVLGDKAKVWIEFDKDVEKHIGTAWTNCLKNANHYSGLRIYECAKAHGLAARGSIQFCHHCMHRVAREICR